MPFGKRDPLIWDDYRPADRPIKGMALHGVKHLDWIEEGRLEISPTAPVWIHMYLSDVRTTFSDLRYPHDAAYVSLYRVAKGRQPSIQRLRDLDGYTMQWISDWIDGKKMRQYGSILD